MDIITGEKIQICCDIYLGNSNKFSFNPFIVDKEKQVDIFVETDFIKLKKNIRHVFCYTDVMNDSFETVYSLLQQIERPFYLYCHNSDVGFQQRHTALLSISHLRTIYTQNLEIDPSDRILPLPIGIANRMWPHGDLTIWNHFLQTQPHKLKTQKIYLNFNISTHPKVRQSCWDIMIEKKITPQADHSYGDYIQLLSEFEFAICPVGNGLDTHRFWECLYVQTIPICLRNPVTEYFSHFFPVILLNQWEDLDIEKLDKKWNPDRIPDPNLFLSTSSFFPFQKPECYFLTFGGGPMNYLDAVDRLMAQAKSLQLFDFLFGMKENDLKADIPFWTRHQNFILKNYRGFGYWIWKPYLIKKVLDQMKEGDILCYCDCGNELDIRKKKRLEELISTVQTELLLGSYPTPIRIPFLNEINWNKKDLLIFMHIDDTMTDILYTNQRQASSLIIKKCNKTVSFVNEWNDIVYNHYHLIDDSPSIERNHECFIEHRHDQSVFSLLSKKHHLFSETLVDTAIDVFRNRSGTSQLER